MKRFGSGFGLVGLVVVLAIVLLLVAKQWQETAPVALELETLSADDVAPETLGDDPLPGLREMNARTDAHADRLRETLAAADASDDGQD